MNFASEYVLAEKSRRKRGILNDLLDLDDQPDTNVVSMKFNQLIETCYTHAGDPIKCNNCEAILSKISKVSDKSSLDGKKTWKCEFCNFENRIFIDENEIPSSEEVTYIMEPAAAREDTTEFNAYDSKYLIYCIDISGSMSITTEVPGDFILPTDRVRRDNLYSVTGERYHHGRVRHISRLEAVQLAITSNLEKLEKENPERRVGIVAFNNSVNVIGDGSMEKLKISGEYLDSREEIKKHVEKTPDLNKISQNKSILNDKLLNLEEGGATALGPALYYSVLLASRKHGSQVILCTDGLANKGIGSLESTDEEAKSAFYNEVAKLAADNGVSVSILTIKGTDCKLGLIGDVADKTSGVVNITDPLKLKEEFSNVLAEQIIATHVKATFILHKALYIRDHLNITSKESVAVKEIGNVTKETEITLEFGLRDDSEIDTNVTKELPFQLKIEYYALDGCKTLRVLTNLKKITEERKQAEEATDRKVLATHCTQTKSHLLKLNASSSLADRMSNYIRRIIPKKEDGFANETFNAIDSDLDSLRAHRSRDVLNTASRPNITSSFNAYENLTDVESSRAYRYKNFKSKEMSKK